MVVKIPTLTLHQEKFLLLALSDCDCEMSQSSCLTELCASAPI